LRDKLQILLVAVSKSLGACLLSGLNQHGGIDSAARRDQILVTVLRLPCV